MYTATVNQSIFRDLLDIRDSSFQIAVLFLYDSVSISTSPSLAAQLVHNCALNVSDAVRQQIDENATPLHSGHSSHYEVNASNDVVLIDYAVQRVNGFETYDLTFTPEMVLSQLSPARESVVMSWMNVVSTMSKIPSTVLNDVYKCGFLSFKPAQLLFSRRSARIVLDSKYVSKDYSPRFAVVRLEGKLYIVDVIYASQSPSFVSSASQVRARVLKSPRSNYVTNLISILCSMFQLPSLLIYDPEFPTDPYRSSGVMSQVSTLYASGSSKLSQVNNESLSGLIDYLFVSDETSLMLCCIDGNYPSADALHGRLVNTSIDLLTVSDGTDAVLATARPPRYVEQPIVCHVGNYHYQSCESENYIVVWKSGDRVSCFLDYHLFPFVLNSAALRSLFFDYLSTCIPVSYWSPCYVPKLDKRILQMLKHAYNSNPNDVRNLAYNYCANVNPRFHELRSSKVLFPLLGHNVLDMSSNALLIDMQKYVMSEEWLVSYVSNIDTMNLALKMPVMKLTPVERYFLYLMRLVIIKKEILTADACHATAELNCYFFGGPITSFVCLTRFMLAHNMFLNVSGRPVSMTSLEAAIYYGDLSMHSVLLLLASADDVFDLFLTHRVRASIHNVTRFMSLVHSSIHLFALRRSIYSILYSIGCKFQSWFAKQTSSMRGNSAFNYEIAGDARHFFWMSYLNRTTHISETSELHYFTTYYEWTLALERHENILLHHGDARSNVAYFLCQIGRYHSEEEYEATSVKLIHHGISPISRMHSSGTKLLLSVLTSIINLN